ncbi:hypothetical protein D3C80_1250670 [compost metagenome]
MKDATVEIGHGDRTCWREHVHASSGIVAAGLQRPGIGQFDLRGIAGEFGFSAGKSDPCHLTHYAASAIGADKPAAPKHRAARLNGDILLGLLEAFHGKPTPYLDAQSLGPRRQNGLYTRHIGGKVAGRTGKAIRPALRVDLVVKKLDAREMPGGPPLPFHPVRRPRRITAGLPLFDRLEQTASIKAFDRRHRQAAQAEGRPFQG